MKQLLLVASFVVISVGLSAAEPQPPAEKSEAKPDKQCCEKADKSCCEEKPAAEKSCCGDAGADQADDAKK